MFDIARVAEVRPESHALDIVIMKDGRRFSGVQVLSHSGGGDFGHVGFGVPTNTGYDAKKSNKRDVYCVVGWVTGTPVIFGFLYPQVSQMLFEDKERHIHRLPSDVYWSSDSDGNIEVYHPSGAFVRFGTSPEHEDLSGKDYDQIWSIERNTDKQVHIHVEQAGAVASIDIDPDGNTVIKAPYVKIDAPKTVMTGRLTVKGSIAAVGTIGSEDDVVSDGGGKSLNTHTHTDPQGGNVGQPTGGGSMPTQDD